MLKKLILSSVLCTFFSLQSFAQAEKFEFIENNYDFGAVDEGVNALWEFKFRNVGPDTITLQPTDVRASCGCTTPSMSKDPIPPGGIGSVSAQFNSAGRPGIFNKNVTVSYQGAVVKTLVIKGVVFKPEEKQEEVAASLTAKKGKVASAVLWTEKTTHNFGKVERGQKVSVNINIKNNGNDTLNIINGQAACSCLTYKLMMLKKDKTSIEVKNVPPGKTAYLEVVYYPTGDGKNRDILTLQTNDKSAPRKPLIFTADVVNSLQEKSPVQEGNSTVPFGR